MRFFSEVEHRASRLGRLRRGGGAVQTDSPIPGPQDSQSNVPSPQEIELGQTEQQKQDFTAACSPKLGKFSV